MVALGIILLVSFFGLSQSEVSKLATSLQSVGAEKVRISTLIEGDWDFACTISETASPEAVAMQVAQKSLRFDEVANSRRKLLYDGETGLVLVSNQRGIYVLYLVFNIDRAAIIHKDGPQCLPFDRASLSQTLKRENWRYFELADCGNC